jgi:hypothetical protein
MADSKFSTFLSSKKLDARRLVIASHAIETLQREDRAQRLLKRQARNTEGAEKPKDLPKARSGRPITPRALTAALEGKHVSGPTKSRILRAVNSLLTQKKQEVVTLKVLF